MPLSDEELKQIDPIKNLNSRPQKDHYYLALALLVARRSFDPSSKCGCVLVSADNRILSTGYNGPLKNSIDEEIPLTRPDRYYHMLHAEENALLAYNGSYQDIQGSTAYITGRPCHKCLRMLIQKGISKIRYGAMDTKVVDQKDLDAQDIMINKWIPPYDIRLKGRSPRVDIAIVENISDIIFILEDIIKDIENILGGTK